MNDELDVAFDGVRAFLDRHYPGDELDELRLVLRSGRKIILPAPVRGRSRSPVHSPTRHSADFRTIRWYGRTYRLTPMQAAVVEQLWIAQDQGTPDIAEATLLEAAGSDTPRVRDLFRNSEAWDVLIVTGSRRGTYRLGDRGADE